MFYYSYTSLSWSFLGSSTWVRNAFGIGLVCTYSWWMLPSKTRWKKIKNCLCNHWAIGIAKAGFLADASYSSTMTCLPKEERFYQEIHCFPTLLRISVEVLPLIEVICTVSRADHVDVLCKNAFLLPQPHPGLEELIGVALIRGILLVGKIVLLS